MCCSFLLTLRDRQPLSSHTPESGYRQCVADTAIHSIECLLLCRAKRAAAAAAPQPTYMAVVEVASEPELSTAFPQGAPVVHLIRSPAALQDKEAAHLAADEGTNMPEGATLEVSLQLAPMAAQEQLKLSLDTTYSNLFR
jgi:hypothetical protein